MTSRKGGTGTFDAHNLSRDSAQAPEPPLDGSRSTWVRRPVDQSAPSPPQAPPFESTLLVATASSQMPDMTTNDEGLNAFGWYGGPTTPGSFISDPYNDQSEFLTPSFGDTLEEPFDILHIRDDNDVDLSEQSWSDAAHMSILTDARSFDESISMRQTDASGQELTEPSRNIQLMSPELTNPSTPVTEPRASPNRTNSYQQDLEQSVVVETAHGHAAPLSTRTSPSSGTALLSNQRSGMAGINTTRLTVDTTDLQNSDTIQSPVRLHQRTPSIQMHPPAESLNAELRTGYDPDQRDNATIPSLEDMEKAQHLSAKIQNVEQWLESDAGSDAEDRSSLRPRRARGGRIRAKSASDLNANRGISDANIPGPGVFIKEDVDDEDEDEDGNEDDESIGSEDGFSAVKDYQTSTDERPKQLSDFAADNTPDSANITQLPPWVDAPNVSGSQIPGNQPYSSNAAMAMFQRRTKETDSASITATIGSSRRRSFSDIGSIYSGIDSRPGSILIPGTAATPKPSVSPRRSGIFGRVPFPKRGNSNARKRKESEPTPKPGSPEIAHNRKGSQGSSRLDRTGSWGQDKSPTAERSSAVSPISTLSLTPSSPFRAISGALRRTRSRSELTGTGGLGEMLAKQGGPPMLSLPKGSADELEAGVSRTTPINKAQARDDDDDDSDEEDESSPLSVNIAMNLKVRRDDIIPTHEGFKTHVKMLNPRLDPFMIERVAAEQLKRYKRLLENRMNHAKKGNKCPSGKFCSLQEGEPDYLPPRNSGKGSEAQAVIFYIASKGGRGDGGELAEDSTSVLANFPDGIPNPPVDRLPAKFECPLCFQVKSISKPSDWTKHVHEDLQPFTCTFADCSQPKSFKRKADWVRHENELHRQLEKWVCSLPDCPKRECYRKNNFVHHLSREHHLDQRSNGQTIVPQLVQECRVWNNKEPKEEPCRFCYNLCPKWKILNVHLAKHLEQISMPLILLVDSMAVKHQPAQKSLEAEHTPAQGSIGISGTFDHQSVAQKAQAPATDTWVQSYDVGYNTSSQAGSNEYYNGAALGVPGNIIQSHSALQGQYPNQMLSPSSSSMIGDNRMSASRTYPPSNTTLPRQPGTQMVANHFLQGESYTASPTEGPGNPSPRQFAQPNMAVTYPPPLGHFGTEAEIAHMYETTSDQFHYSQMAPGEPYGHDGMSFANSYLNSSPNTGFPQNQHQHDQQPHDHHHHHQQQGGGGYYYPQH